MKKRVIVLMLCFCMLLITACSKAQDEQEVETSNNQTTSIEEDTSVEDKKDPEDTQGEDTQEETSQNQSLPLCEEKEELGVWINWSSSYLTDPNELLSVAELEKRTNVHINWSPVSSIEAKEKFGLMMAAGSYPDIVFFGNQYYTGGASVAVDDGVFIPLDDVVENYMPNYSKYLEDADLKRKATDDNGNIDALWRISTLTDGTVAGGPIWTGYCIRQDWLDELGLDVPKTIDDWYTVLTAFKENMGCEYPLSIPMIGASVYTTAFLSAYDVLPDYYQVDGQVKYGPMEEGYKKWMDLFRQWYAEGLIDPNFPSNRVYINTDYEVMALGKCGAGIMLDSMTGGAMYEQGMTTEEDFWLTATPSPVLNEGDVIRSNFSGRDYMGFSINITSNCENVELAAKWLDYLYSEDGSRLMNYGIENDSFYLDENGEPQWTEKILNGFNDLTPKDSQKMYTFESTVPGIFMWDVNRKITPDANTAVAADTWSTDQQDWTISSAVQLNLDEMRDFNTHSADVSTLVSEFTIQYITGIATEEDYNNFISNMKQYGIEECIALKQAALDRYNSK